MTNEQDVVMRGVEERYEKEGGKVYRYWRFAGSKKWSRQLTAYKEVPYVKTETY